MECSAPGTTCSEVLIKCVVRAVGMKARGEPDLEEPLGNKK